MRSHVPEEDVILQVSELKKRFGRTQVLDSFSMSLGAGERVALLGPNGAGKTTLIRAICGRVKLDAGTIRISGQRADPLQISQHTGLVPQEIAVYADLSARENLCIFGRLSGLSRQSLCARVDWALDWIGLKDRANHLIKTFSGGMKRRVNIACGVLHKPTLLLLDEPTVGVDPQSRQRIFQMLADLHQCGTGMLMTTHYLEEAQSQCDRIIIMDHGRNIAQGTLSELTSLTLGEAKYVRIEVEPLIVPAGVSLQISSHHRALTGHIQDVADDLPLLLTKLRRSGLTIRDCHVHSPTLDDVFLSLTGRELRE